MWNMLAWAMLTGGITGAVWVGIVMIQRQQRAAARRHQLVDAYHEGADYAGQVDGRLAEMEERLDFAERLLTQRRAPERRIDP